MSMFYELMMRKKQENFLYPVIKGSLTESPYGVFSGFSSSNYLEIPSFDRSKNWEQEFTFITGEIINSSNLGIYSENTSNTYKNRLNIYGNSLAIYMTSNGTAFNIASGVTIQNIFESNTKYSLKILFNGSAYKILLKTLNGEYTEIWSKNTNLVWTSNPQIVGLEYTHAFNGSIDLNRSYIKLGVTKYKLQAVVGYTVVGSPTISDGVVSGFSVDDYLKIQKSLDDLYNVEFNFKISNFTNKSNNIILGSVYSYQGIYLNNSNKILFQVYAPNETNVWQQVTTSYSLVNNTTYTINVKLNNNQVVFEIYDENNSLLHTENHQLNFPFLNTAELRIGGKQGWGFFSGSIDINETYIKINNKLWFNGQQA